MFWGRSLKKPHECDQSTWSDQQSGLSVRSTKQFHKPLTSSEGLAWLCQRLWIAQPKNTRPKIIYTTPVITWDASVQPVHPRSFRQRIHAVLINNLVRTSKRMTLDVFDPKCIEVLPLEMIDVTETLRALRGEPRPMVFLTEQTPWTASAWRARVQQLRPAWTDILPVAVFTGGGVLRCVAIASCGVCRRSAAWGGWWGGSAHETQPAQGVRIVRKGAAEWLPSGPRPPGGAPTKRRRIGLLAPPAARGKADLGRSLLGQLGERAIRRRHREGASPLRTADVGYRSGKPMPDQAGRQHKR